MNYSVLTLFIGFGMSTSATGLAPTEELEDRRVIGADAQTLAAAMKESGAKVEPLGENGGASLPSEHPAMPIGKDSAYRMSTVVCRKKKCSPFVLEPKKMKKVEQIFRKLGVKTHPVFFIRDLSCGVATSERPEIACFVTAHFHPKDKPKK